MSKISQHRAFLLAAIVPAFLVAGCSAGSDTSQAMKGAASPTETGMTPTETGTDMSPPATGGAAQPEQAVQNYFNAVKSGKVDQVVGSFSDDAVVALDGEATAEGTQAIRSLYQEELQGETGQAEATHTVEEARTLGKQDAIVRSTSKMGEENLRELFVLTRKGKDWKISQLMENQAG
ncbi:nuclear transport factor 2 family protein [Nonomuraea sp. K274]|uniref:Nuclear transport factor 2 family protein n=1 Tax=Nonomuraea cypriaca TaxID=1187855 RepID=A0A931AC57_9ACTN|nr:nuclear transport factor 2 family protein [Nonomuraea cypriaca]MBF8187848.1 nuclear transport factor 2 family protein [Nonomuraea cypriaca]